MLSLSCNANSGDFTNGDGTGGEPAVEEVKFDENFIIKHSKGGLLSMANCKYCDVLIY